MTPGQNTKPYVAGALHRATGKLVHGLGTRTTHAWFRDLLTRLDHTYPAPGVRRVYVVVDHYSIHKAQAVEHWLADHPRVHVLGVPTSGPRAHPIARVFGDVHDKCTRNHQRKRLPNLIKDVARYVQENGPWPYKLSQIYYEPTITAAVETMGAEAASEVAA